MKVTGIVRRIDDLGRVVIPKEIRRTMNIKEGDPLEFFVSGRTLILKKYQPSTEKLAEDCVKFVNKVRNNITSIGFCGDTTAVVLKNGKSAAVVKHPNDTYDINVAVCYALAKMGVLNCENPVINNV